MLATIVEGNPKSPFTIATTPRCRGGRYSFPGWLYFTLDPHLIMLSVKQGGIKYHFLSLWYDRSPGPLANTLTARPMSDIYIYIYIYICIEYMISKQFVGNSLQTSQSSFVCQQLNSNTLNYLTQGFISPQLYGFKSC